MKTTATTRTTAPGKAAGSKKTTGASKAAGASKGKGASKASAAKKTTGTSKTARARRAAGTKKTAGADKAASTTEAAEATALALPLETPAMVLPVEVEPGNVEVTLKKLREELSHWVKKGRYTKVRFKVRGKPILPDIPIAAMVAAEALSFWWAGLLKVLLVNVGAGSLLDIELVSDADLEVGRGKQALLAGDLDRAIEAFNAALQMDRDSASAHLNLGIAQKLRGDREGARGFFEKAEQLNPTGPIGDEARRLLDLL